MTFIRYQTLDIVLSLAWRNTWDAQTALSEQLKIAASSLPNASVAEILTWTAPLRRHVNERYDVVMTYAAHSLAASLRSLMKLTWLAHCRVARVDGALYAFCSLLVICANLGGMALVLTLRRQIRYMSYLLCERIAAVLTSPCSLQLQLGPHSGQRPDSDPSCSSGRRGRAPGTSVRVRAARP